MKAPTEAEFQAQVVELAHVYGWRVAHFRSARTQHGWRTPVAADGAGFPDLVLVRDRIIFAEVKAERGRLSLDQRLWLAALGGAGAEIYVWRPSSWPEIERTLLPIGSDTLRRRAEASPSRSRSKQHPTR